MKPTNPKVCKPETKLQPHRGDARKMSAGDLREVILARVDGLKGEILEYVQGALERNNNLAFKLKQWDELRDSIEKRLFAYAQRIAEIERQMKSAIAAGILSQMKEAEPAGPDKPAPAPAPVPAEMPAFVQVRAPLPAWRKETKEAVSKLGSGLPALASIPELASYFGVSYTKIHTAIIRGRLAVTRQGRATTRGRPMMIPREAVAEYVRVYGVPRQRKLFYGAAGVAEFEKA